jgi:hypothetical protein
MRLAKIVPMHADKKRAAIGSPFLLESRESLNSQTPPSR